MSDRFCPGARSLRQPEPETFVYPHCGGDVEIWTDEMRRVCPTCGAAVIRDSAMACLEEGLLAGRVVVAHAGSVSMAAARAR